MSQELNLDALKREAEIMRSFKAWGIIDRLIDRIRELERAQPAGEAAPSIPPIFYNGETKRNPEFKARVEKWTDEQNRKLDAAIDRTFAAPPAAPPASVNQAGKTVDELAMMVRLLVHALRKAAPANPLSVRAMDYLERHGLQGSILRAAPPAAGADDSTELPPMPKPAQKGWIYTSAQMREYARAAIDAALRAGNQGDGNGN